MAFKHGAYASEQSTAIATVTTSDMVTVAIGAAPVHLASDRADANKPIICHTYKEAVEQFGYSDDWESYPLCGVMKVFFSRYNVAPVVFINVLDVKNSAHITAVAESEKTVTDMAVVLSASEAVLKDTLVVALTAGGEALVAGTDYIAAYNDEEELVITITDDGAAKSAASLFVKYSKLKPSAVDKDTVIGGVSAETGQSKGLEVLDMVYPYTGSNVGIIIAPGYSHNTSVAAAMAAKCEGLSGVFGAVAVVDISTTEVKKYTHAYSYKNDHGLTDRNTYLVWPMTKLDGKIFYGSVDAAARMIQTDSKNGDVPYESPSNKAVVIDGACLADGTEVYLYQSQGNNLNQNGITTFVNMNGWKIWGNFTAAKPESNDVKDYFLPIRRMFQWVSNTLILTFLTNVDNPLNVRLRNTILDSANIWLNGLVANGKLLGGRVEFREDENPITDLMAGIARFHVYLTPPSPAQDIEFVLEYDASYISEMFS